MTWKSWEILCITQNYEDATGVDVSESCLGTLGEIDPTEKHV